PAAADWWVDRRAMLGAQIVHPALPHRFSDYAAATGRIIGAEGYRFVGHLVDDSNLPTDPHVRPRIQLGRNISARDYLQTLAEMEEHRRTFATALADVDALLTPTTLTPAIPIDQVDQSGQAAHFTRVEIDPSASSFEVRTDEHEVLFVGRVEPDRGRLGGEASVGERDHEGRCLA